MNSSWFLDMHDWVVPLAVVLGSCFIGALLYFFSRPANAITAAFEDCFAAMASLKLLILALRDSAILAHAEVATMRAAAAVSGSLEDEIPVYATVTVDQVTLTVPAAEIGKAIAHIATPVDGATFFAKIEYCSGEAKAQISGERNA